jgi:hypothetical protein
MHKSAKHRNENRRIALSLITQEIPNTAQGCTARDASTLDRTESTLSSPDTPVSGKDWTRNEDQKRAARPNDREARGRLTLKASAHHPGAVRAVCSIEHRVLTLSKASRDTRGNGSQHISPVVFAEVPLEELAVRLQRGRADMFTIATRHKCHKNRLYDEIYCFADDESERDEWIAVFRQMGIPILHLREASNPGALDAPLDDGHAPPSEQDPARWASAGAAGVALQRQKQELLPASSASCASLASMVIKIKSETVKLHAAVALYNRERQRTPADDAGAPSPPAVRSRSSSPLPLSTPIPKVAHTQQIADIVLMEEADAQAVLAERSRIPTANNKQRSDKKSPAELHEELMHLFREAMASGDVVEVPGIPRHDWQQAPHFHSPFRQRMINPELIAGVPCSPSRPRSLRRYPKPKTVRAPTPAVACTTPDGSAPSPSST